MNRKILAVILLLFIAVGFLTLPRTPLLNDDASAYALAAKNAIIHDQWFAQFFTPGDRASFLDKPPLGIWLLAWPAKIAGINETTIHFSNVLYYSLFLLFLYLALARIGAKKIALYAVLIAATSLTLVVYSRAPKLDILLTLFISAAHFFVFSYLKKERPIYLYLFSLSLALGFLVKSGFGILPPGLTVISLLLFNPKARDKLLKAAVSPIAPLCALLFLSIIGGVLYSQSFPLKDQFIPYLKSIFIQGKYNTHYLGAGIHYPVIGLLLIAIFPWTPFAFSSLKIKFSRRSLLTAHCSLRNFCSLWFWSNFLFFLFFYRLADLRTFALLAPPLSILAAIRLVRYRSNPSALIWNIFFLLIFAVVLAALSVRPYNAEGVRLTAAIAPLSLFTVSLLALTIYLWRPSFPKFALTFALVCLSYGTLFYNTPLVTKAFNPEVKWPGMIKERRQKGDKFYIYRPRDRNLYYSPDLCYVDFIAGPADKYFWDGNQLKKELKKEKAVVLSDTKSWGKLRIQKDFIVLAKDDYAGLIRVD